jgi:hypothetical protein
VTEEIVVGTAVAIGVSEVGEDVMGVGEGVIGVGEGVIVGVGLDCAPTSTGGPTILGRSKTSPPTRISTEGS